MTTNDPHARSSHAGAPHPGPGSPLPDSSPSGTPTSGSSSTGSSNTDSSSTGSPSPHSPHAALAGRQARVITASSRAAAGVYPDRGGALIAETLRGWGMDVPDPVVVPDGPAVAEALRIALADTPHLLLTTGGTGLTLTDGTPEATALLLDRQIPGIPEAIRAFGAAHGIPTAVLSRGVAGLAGRTLVVNLPGSLGGVRDSLAVLEPLLPHAFSQIEGGDH